MHKRVSSNNFLPFILKSAHKGFALLLVTLCVLLVNCSPNPGYQGKGEFFLQGEWQQDTTAVQKKLVTYSLYNLKFNCDSFFVRISTFSKVNYGADTCMNKGRWAEYAKGNYEMRHDTLVLKGFFCQPNWELKAEGGCFRYGVYEEIFKLTKKTDAAYQFLSTASVTPFSVHLIKKITCIPKPL